MHVYRALILIRGGSVSLDGNERLLICERARVARYAAPGRAARYSVPGWAARYAAQCSAPARAGGIRNERNHNFVLCIHIYIYIIYTSYLYIYIYIYIYMFLIFPCCINTLLGPIKQNMDTLPSLFPISHCFPLGFRS